MRATLRWTALAAALAFSGCSRGADVTRTTPGEAVGLPSFAVRVVLSPEDSRALVAAGEAVVVHAWFDGDGDAMRRRCDPFRAVYLGDAKVELRGPPWVARFEGVRVAKADLARLDAPDFHVGVNAFTGRRTSPDNLLRGEAFLGRIEAMRGTTTDLACSLAVRPHPADRGVESLKLIGD